MSGIFGIVARDGRPVGARDLAPMRAAMAHRGPDGGGLWHRGAVGLGQLMLHSTPESEHETLPWEDTASGFVITADARLDNRDELIRGLQLEGASGLPDSRLILAGYKRWGEDCVQRLLGDFAFAIWDPVERRLFCARDPLGIRPFYYHLAADAFVFASSALGVTAAEAVPRRLNDTRIVDFLVQDLEGADDTVTWFEAVRRLPPGHRAVLSDGGFHAARYWTPDADHELTLGSDEEYLDAFEEVLADAIRVRLRSHRPVASMLSGGIDSSAIVGIARRLLERAGEGRLATFSGMSDDANDRESRFCRRVIEQGGVDANLLRPADVPDYAARLDALETDLEDPFDFSWTLHQMIYSAARERGHVAVMDGADGDGVASLTSCYPTFLVREGHWLTAAREMHGLWKNYYSRQFSRVRIASDLLRPVVVPEFVRRLKQRLVTPEPVRFAAASPVARGAVLDRAVQRLRRMDAQAAMSGCPDLRHAHIRRMTVPYLTAGIERYGRLAACAGVEQREPLLDRRVVAFCIALPWRQKVRDGWSKWVLRRVAERVVGSEVAWRVGWDPILWQFRRRRVDALLRQRGEALERLDARIGTLLDPRAYAGVVAAGRSGAGEAAGTAGNLLGLAAWISRIE